MLLALALAVAPQVAPAAATDLAYDPTMDGVAFARAYEQATGVRLLVAIEGEFGLRNAMLPHRPFEIPAARVHATFEAVLVANDLLLAPHTRAAPHVVELRPAEDGATRLLALSGGGEPRADRPARAGFATVELRDERAASDAARLARAVLPDGGLGWTRHVRGTPSVGVAHLGPRVARTEALLRWLADGEAPASPASWLPPSAETDLEWPRPGPDGEAPSLWQLLAPYEGATGAHVLTSPGVSSRPLPPRVGARRVAAGDAQREVQTTLADLGLALVPLTDAAPHVLVVLEVPGPVTRAALAQVALPVAAGDEGLLAEHPAVPFLTVLCPEGVAPLALVQALGEDDEAQVHAEGDEEPVVLWGRGAELADRLARARTLDG